MSEPEKDSKKCVASEGDIQIRILANQLKNRKYRNRAIEELNKITSDPQVALGHMWSVNLCLIDTNGKEIDEVDWLAQEGEVRDAILEIFKFWKGWMILVVPEQIEIIVLLQLGVTQGIQKEVWIDVDEAREVIDTLSENGEEILKSLKAPEDYIESHNLFIKYLRADFMEVAGGYTVRPHIESQIIVAHEDADANMKWMN